MPKDLLVVADLGPTQIESLLDRAARFRLGLNQDKALAGRSAVMIFEKPSLRTKVSFELAVHQLGGHPVFLTGAEVGLGTREPIEDVAHVLQRWVAVIIARVNDHQTLVDLAQSSNIPVINALSDVEHPCQAIADVLTIAQHFGDLPTVRVPETGLLSGLKIAFVGDGNNCARSLGQAAVALGAHFHIASPEGYELDDESLASMRGNGRTSSSVDSTNDPVEAVAGAHVVYTDVWASMGQEEEAMQRRAAFHGFSITPTLLTFARPDVILMHPMPAHYGDEITPGMLKHPSSVAFDQAENRLHAQKAILDFLAKGK